MHKKVKYETEAHHIHPTCYFPELITDDSNIVNLPKRAHFIAHKMLAFAIGGKMWRAFQLMGRIKNHNSRHYVYFKEQAAIENSCPIKRKKSPILLNCYGRIKNIENVKL